MAITVDELAVIVDSTIDICITDEGTSAVSLVIIGLQLRIGGGPTLKDVTGFGVDAAAARTDYATKVAGQVAVVGGNPRGIEVRVPLTIVAGP